MSKAAVGRREINQHQRRGRGLLHRHAIVEHRAGQLRIGLQHPHLGEDLVGIRHRVDAEVDGESHLAVARILRGHVVHPIHAGHLLLDRGRHRLGDGVGIGAGVVGDDLNLRIGDFGKLRRGQAKQGDHAAQ